jgi:hypothetical protein
MLRVDGLATFGERICRPGRIPIAASEYSGVELIHKECRLP